MNNQRKSRVLLVLVCLIGILVLGGCASAKTSMLGGVRP